MKENVDSPATMASVLGGTEAGPWLARLTEAYSSAATPQGLSAWLPKDGPAAARGELLRPLLPLVDHAKKSFQEKLANEVGSPADHVLPFDRGDVVDLFMARLPFELLPMVSRTLALELQVAGIEERLRGSTSQERFRSFLEPLTTPRGAVRLWAQYPVLARQILLRLEQWIESSLELLRRLATDWRRIAATFPGAEAHDCLTSVEGDAGDPHRCGRRVHILIFRSGLRLVYKPRALAVEAHFQELLAWLNSRGDHPPFPLLRILDRGGYGWVEHVAAHDCRSRGELTRFYERQGAYIALLYALEATDFHSGNLIAAGENPVLVDLESLFHPRIRELEGSDPITGKLLGHSVLRVGLLPRRLGGASPEDLDISGLGSVAGQLTPAALACLEDVGTDRMRVKRRRFELHEARNRPRIAGAAANPLDHTEAIVRGFSSLYHTLVHHRDELLADSGILARFAADDVRVILRPTRGYVRLLQESFHPTLLADIHVRDRHFDRLWKLAEQVPEIGRVIPSERRDLERGDVPLFTARVDSRHLEDSGGRRIEKFFAEAPLALVRRRLAGLGPADLARQRWIIRASLATLASGLERRNWPSSRASAVAQAETLSRQELLKAACGVGDRLQELALEDAGSVAWLGFEAEGGDRWGLVPLDMDFYSGLPGVALFLAYLAAESGQERYRRLARLTARTLLRWLADQDLARLPTGAFSGLAGWIYTFNHLGILWQEPEWLDQAARLVAAIPPKIRYERGFDVIGGAAGCVAVLLSLRLGALGRDALAAARACGERLLALAEPTERGLAWPCATQHEPPLAGFAHGAAGAAWALAKLSAACGEDRFRAAALQAITYERGLFCEKAGNWADLRDLSKLRGAVRGEYDSVAWCHGAAGIGLARLDTFSLLDGAMTRREIEAALAATVEKGFGKNHCLCHGELGNLELIHEASRRWNRPQWQGVTTRRAAAVLESIEAQGYLCGVPLGTETPGMMAGLAGIGYGLLRLASPDRVASVLLLEPPRGVHACSP